MPTLQPLSHLSTRSSASSSALPAVNVVCAFPVSSNFGPGSRILYYVLVAACVAFRKEEWLRNVCLAAALVLPAISAVQALVLVSAHVNGAVDLDIYGAFQICAIGILAAPITVRFSRTYFFDPGRNIIFLWTILLLMGLVALCVEFYRVTPTPCRLNDQGRPISVNVNDFPYGIASCGLTCNEQDGPISILRGGSSSNVYVIPVPRILTFDACMLLAAGFCIPAILSLFFTADKILDINWKQRRETQEQRIENERELNTQIEGATMTVGELKGINHVVRKFLGVIEVIVYGGIILTIIGIGEANFFSSQLMYQTEPMASIGQWSPIAGVILAGVGSLYVWWASGGDDASFQENHNMKERTSPTSNRSLNRTLSRGRSRSPIRVVNDDLPTSRLFVDDNAVGIHAPSPHTMRLVPTITTPDVAHVDGDLYYPTTQVDPELPTAGRHRMRRWFTSAGDYLGNAAHEKFDASDYRNKKAHRFPAIPGEDLRNPDFERTYMQYAQMREENSKVGSMYSASIASGFGIEASSTPLPPESSRPSSTTRPLDSQHPSGTAHPREYGQSNESPAPNSVLLPKGRDTLQVPPQSHGHRRSGSFGESSKRARGDAVG